MKKLYLVFKWIMDELVSLVALILLSPFFIGISIAIKVTSKGPVVFKQSRIGKNKKLFKVHKFRTMYIDTPKDCPTHLLENPDKYITKIGKFLRKTSLDELPQIWDIFRGKMSIIGPRPALYNQDDLVAERDLYNANNLRPGLTGLAQISGRDELEIPVKAKLDGEYYAKVGLRMDIKIFFKTIINVLKKDGVKEGRSNIKNQEIQEIQEEIATDNINSQENDNSIDIVNNPDNQDNNQDNSQESIQENNIEVNQKENNQDLGTENSQKIIKESYVDIDTHSQVEKNEADNQEDIQENNMEINTSQITSTNI